MSEENKDKKPQKKDEHDPYSFFRFSTDPDDEKKKGSDKPPRFPFWTVMLAVVVALALFNIFAVSKNDELIDFSLFRSKIESGEIVKVDLTEGVFTGYGPEISLPEHARTPQSDPTLRLFPWMARAQQAEPNRISYRTQGILTDSFLSLLDEKGVDYRLIPKQNNYLVSILLQMVVPFALFALIYVFILKKMGGMGGGMGSIFGTGGSRAKAVDEGKVKTRFADVAGVDEAKEELMEVVDFLKQPKKYTDIGGKIPKGVLLVGPPGTGKTLLARAVAGEAGVPFFRISGSDFVEVFVGVGASRVRDLFKQAREKAPCIIFIDEIDAIGKSRASSLASNDEREQTLNQMLVEMDGFDNEKGLIVLAATNRADVLDPALLRPGRFDRQVPVERPDVKGREAILRIHAKNVKLDDDVDFTSLAHGTTGFAGADLANVVNEAALLAVRNGRSKVTMLDFNEAIDKVSIGLKKKTRKENEKEMRRVAVHETGHALVGAFTPDYPPVNKITVVPRSHGVGGFTQYTADA